MRRVITKRGISFSFSHCGVESFLSASISHPHGSTFRLMIVVGKLIRTKDPNAGDFAEDGKTRKLQVRCQKALFVCWLLNVPFVPSDPNPLLSAVLMHLGRQAGQRAQAIYVDALLMPFAICSLPSPPIQHDARSNSQSLRLFAHFITPTCRTCYLNIVVIIRNILAHI